MLFGNSNGMKTLTVLTGISKEEDVLNSVGEMKPDYYTTSIAQLLSADL